MLSINLSKSLSALHRITMLFEILLSFYGMYTTFRFVQNPEILGISTAHAYKCKTELQAKMKQWKTGEMNFLYLKKHRNVQRS